MRPLSVSSLIYVSHPSVRRKANDVPERLVFVFVGTEDDALAIFEFDEEASLPYTQSLVAASFTTLALGGLFGIVQVDDCRSLPEIDRGDLLLGHFIDGHQGTANQLE